MAHTTSRRPREFVQHAPSTIFRFPRDNWDGVVFGHPVFHPAEVGLKCQWAAREASRRWTHAFESGVLDLDGVDFALAVLDMVTLANQYARKLRRELGRYEISTEDWMTSIEHFVRAVFGVATKTIVKNFPNHPNLNLFSLDSVRSFVPAAMQRLWIKGEDGIGQQPSLTPIHERYFRYIPAPEDVPPRLFTLMDPYDRHPDAPLRVWLDSDFNQVDPPDDLHQLEGTAPSAKHEGSTLITDELTVSRDPDSSVSSPQSTFEGKERRAHLSREPHRPSTPVVSPRSPWSSNPTTPCRAH